MLLEQPVMLLHQLWGWQAASGLCWEWRGASHRSPVSLAGCFHAATNCTTSDAGCLVTVLPAPFSLSASEAECLYQTPETWQYFERLERRMMLNISKRSSGCRDDF